MSATASMSAANESRLTVHKERPKPNDRRSDSTLQRSKFLHTPLSLDTTTIRLLRILPELSEDGLVQCEIQHFDLDEANPPHYHALSYTWGSPQPCKTILLNDAVLTVRENLWDFLNTARTALRDVGWIFADAVCINQDDGEEKVHQIKQMRATYSLADCVIVWLGSGNKDVYRLMELAQEVGIETLAFHLRRIDLDDDDGARWKGNLSRENAMRGLQALIEHPYWRRVWILQENLLASSLIVMYDKWTLSWDHFYQLCLSASPIINDSRIHQFQRCRHTRSAPWHWSGFNLFDLFYDFRENECSEPHDRIYGVLAMSDKAHRFPVDYKTGLVELLINTALFAMSDNIESGRNRVLGYFSNSTGFTSFCSYVKDIPLLRTHGVPGIIDVDLDVKIQQRMYSGSWSRVKGKGRILMTYAYFKKHFRSDDLVYSQYPATRIVVRKKPNGYIVVGRISADYSYHENDLKFQHNHDTVLCDVYGSDGLPGVTCSLAEDHRAVTMFSICDIRSAVILFTMPNCAIIRRMAIRMLSDMDTNDRFANVRVYEEYQPEESGLSRLATSLLASMKSLDADVPSTGELSPRRSMRTARIRMRNPNERSDTELRSFYNVRKASEL